MGRGNKHGYNSHKIIMIKIKIADLTIGIDNKKSYTKEICADYLTDERQTDFQVSAAREEILAEDDGSGFTEGYLESLAIYLKIAEKIGEYDGFLMHSVVLDVDGKGVAFSAKSGTGKSTHAAYWGKLLGDRCTVVNGDKPLVRIIDGRVFAYGTPWCGKEFLHTNMRTELKAFCLINRSEDNHVVPMKPRTALTSLIAAVYHSPNQANYERTLELMDFFLERVKFYGIYCNMSLDAARTAYNAIWGS